MKVAACYKIILINVKYFVSLVLKFIPKLKDQDLHKHCIGKQLLLQISYKFSTNSDKGHVDACFFYDSDFTMASCLGRPSGRRITQGLEQDMIYYVDLQGEV